MSKAVIMFLFLLMPAAGFAAAAWYMAWRLATPEGWAAERRRMISWTLKGLLAPALIWPALNVGNWSPLMPEVQNAVSEGRNWGPPFLKVTGVGWVIISSYWAAVTLAWVLCETARRLEGDSWAQFKGLCWSCLLIVLVPAGLIAWFGGWEAGGIAGLSLLLPIAGYAPGLIAPPKQRPIYSRAIARVKFGKYNEAEWEIIRQLEKRVTDFEGWMLLAELYAKHFGDMAEAEQTILELCDQPQTTASQLSLALHRLADWHLQFSRDPDAARRTLTTICLRLPGTHLARMAQLRIHQLPATTRELEEQTLAKPIRLPALGDSFDTPPKPAAQGLAREQALSAANQCISRLERNANDVNERENLARIFTEELGQSEQGLEQLALLLGMPNQESSRRAEWLAMTASWQIRYRGDTAAGRAILEQIIQEHPHCSQALAARRRLERL